MIFQIINSMRPKHQLKNLLIFTTLIASNSIFIGEKFYITFLSFIFFSITAGCIYIFNDLIDYNFDKKHPEKRLRPIASGKISRKVILTFAIILLVLNLIISNLILGKSFLYILIFYITLSTLYFFYLKRIIIIDVLTLTMFYLIRIIVGSITNEIIISQWLIVFSFFIFFSLALLKRFIELKQNPSYKLKVKNNLSYSYLDLNLVQFLGITSGFISSLVFVLYASSNEIQKSFGEPKILLANVLVLIFFVSRLWILSNRKKINFDLMNFIYKDKVSYLTGIIFVVLFISSKNF